MCPKFFFGLRFAQVVSLRLHRGGKEPVGGSLRRSCQDLPGEIHRLFAASSQQLMSHRDYLSLSSSLSLSPSSSLSLPLTIHLSSSRFGAPGPSWLCSLTTASRRRLSFLLLALLTFTCGSQQRQACFVGLDNVVKLLLLDYQRLLLERMLAVDGGIFADDLRFADLRFGWYNLRCLLAQRLVPRHLAAEGRLRERRPTLRARWFSS